MPNFFLESFFSLCLCVIARNKRGFPRCVVASLRETKEVFPVASLRRCAKQKRFSPLRRCVVARNKRGFPRCVVALLREIKQRNLNNCAKYLLIFSNLYNFLSKIFGKSLVICFPKTYLCVPLIKRRSIPLINTKILLL